MGSFREFAIEPTLEAICVPNPHPSGGVALSLIATHRPQSLFGEVTKHWHLEGLRFRPAPLTMPAHSRENESGASEFHHPNCQTWEFNPRKGSGFAWE